MTIMRRRSVRSVILIAMLVLVVLSGALISKAQTSGTDGIVLPAYADGDDDDNGNRKGRGNDGHSGMRFVYEVVDVPFAGASDTEIFGINNEGDIVGS